MSIKPRVCGGGYACVPHKQCRGLTPRWGKVALFGRKLAKALIPGMLLDRKQKPYLECSNQVMFLVDSSCEAFSPWFVQVSQLLVSMISAKK